MNYLIVTIGIYVAICIGVLLKYGPQAITGEFTSFVMLCVGGCIAGIKYLRERD